MDNLARDEKGLEGKVTVRPARFAALSYPDDQKAVPQNIDFLLDVTLNIAVELGRTKMTIKEVLSLGPGSVVELDKAAGEPVDMRVNDRLMAKGEVVVIDDRFGVRVTDIISPSQRLGSLA